MIALGLLLATGTLLAALYALGKAAAAMGVMPATIVLWQVAGGALGLTAFALVRPQARPPISARHLRYYAVSGLLGVSAPSALAFFALQSLGVGTVALVTALSAVLTYAGEVVIGAESFRGRRFAGCLLGLGGVAVLAGPRGVAADSGGLLAAMGAPMLLAAGNIYRTRAWPPGSAPVALAVGMLIVQLPLVAAAAWWSAPAPVLALPPASLVSMAALAPLMYAAHFALQRRGGPLYVSQLGYVMTIAGAALGYLFFGERPGVAAVVAAALVAAGVLLVSPGAARRAAPHVEPIK